MHGCISIKEGLECKCIYLGMFGGGLFLVGGLQGDDNHHMMYQDVK